MVVTVAASRRRDGRSFISCRVYTMSSVFRNKDRKNSCVMSMSLFSGTKTEMVYLLVVNARLRRAQNVQHPRFQRGHPP